MDKPPAFNLFGKGTGAAPGIGALKNQPILL